ncbi:MAG: diguanylate cyclase [Spirochaetaceae bacterium]|nr:diguanylate cyclase [Spirochaetaceae bacterium]
MEKDTKHTLLIVDDEASVLSVLNRILSGEYGILTAKTGNEALRLAQEQHPNLILLDILLPDLDGYNVIVQLKSNEETNAIPVIFITGLSSEEDEEKSFLLGAADYIIKPFKPAAIRARIRKHLDILHQIKALEGIGLTDSLTGLPNRRSFEDRLEMEWRRAAREQKPLSFLMVDFDGFKAYNDSYGHLQGDALLRAAAGVFIAWAKRPADHPARLGGEEFGVLLPDTDLKPALIIAEGIRAAVEELRLPIKEKTGSVTVSIGVNSIIPQRDSSVTDFISGADEALYAAKKAGKNRICSGQ